MLSRRTIRRPSTGAFQTAVWTVFPCHSMSRGRPTFTESNRAIVFVSSCNRTADTKKAITDRPAAGASRLCGGFRVGLRPRRRWLLRTRPEHLAVAPAYGFGVIDDP